MKMEKKCFYNMRGVMGCQTVKEDEKKVKSPRVGEGKK